MNVKASDGRPNDNSNASRRTRRMALEERDLLTTNSDVELQYNNGAGPGVAFPPPVVTTGIFAGHDTQEVGYEKNRYEDERDEGLFKKERQEVRRGISGIGVTTTVEQYSR